MISNIAEIAKQIAYKTHAGQFRRDGKTPYIEHPAAVASQFPNDMEARAVAWLHDVLEDTDITVFGLVISGIPFHIVSVVELLTRDDSVSYTDYLSSLKKNDLARRVKIADIKHNLSDCPTSKQKAKYAMALQILEN